VAHHDLWFFFTTLVGFVLGGWHFCWACHDVNSCRGLWCRRLGVSAVLCLGCSGLVAAGLRSSWLVPLGLLAGLFIVAMLWEAPEPGWQQTPGK
jgi:hypothetical protein